jgi:chromosome partitioning protein
MACVIAVSTQKGGVGKTTTATNLAAAMTGHYGLRTLVFDLDPQADATAVLLGHQAEIGATIREVLWEPRAAAKVMVPSACHPNLLVVPGSPELASDEKHVTPQQWEEIAQDARVTLLGGLPDDIDVVVIDTPPSLGLWMHCALAAADGYLLLGVPSMLSVRGMGRFMETAEKVRAQINPNLRQLGVVVNNARPVAEDEGYVEMFRERFGTDLLAVVPQRTATNEAISRAIPVEFYADASPDVRGVYREIAGALLQKLGVPRRKAALPYRPPPAAKRPAQNGDVVPHSSGAAPQSEEHETSRRSTRATRAGRSVNGVRGAVRGTVVSAGVGAEDTSRE